MNKMILMLLALTLTESKKFFTYKIHAVINRAFSEWARGHAKLTPMDDYTFIIDDRIDHLESTVDYATLMCLMDRHPHYKSARAILRGPVACENAPLDAFNHE